MKRTAVLLLSALGLVFVLGGVVGCTAKDEQAWTAQERVFEEPRRETLRDDENFADKAGQAAIAVLVVAVALGAIALPFLLF